MLPRWSFAGVLSLVMVLVLSPSPQRANSAVSATKASGPGRSLGCRNPATKGVSNSSGVQNLTLADGPVTSSYSLFVPRSYRSGHPTPLILLFYGFGSNPSQFSSLTELPRRGAREGYVVAVPHAQGGEWQFSGNGTDAEFASSLVEHIESTYCIDTRKVFASGFSAGAAFTIIYACSHQGQIAAIATVAVEFQLGCRWPLSIMAFHGTKDPLVPYKNGATGLSLPGTKVRGTQLNMSDWARLDHCRPTARKNRIGSQVRRQSWNGCSDDTKVILYSIIGGSHSWPGADPKKSIGLTTQQISATTEILGFFNHS